MPCFKLSGSHTRPLWVGNFFYFVRSCVFFCARFVCKKTKKQIRVCEWEPEWENGKEEDRPKTTTTKTKKEPFVSRNIIWIIYYMWRRKNVVCTSSHTIYAHAYCGICVYAKNVYNDTIHTPAEQSDVCTHTIFLPILNMYSYVYLHEL